MLIEQVVAPYNPELKNEYIDLYNSLYPNDQRSYDCKKCGSEVFGKLIFLKNKQMPREKSDKKYVVKPVFLEKKAVLMSKKYGRIDLTKITDEQIEMLVNDEIHGGYYLTHFDEVK